MLVGKLVSLLGNLPQAIAEAEQAVVSATRALKDAEDALALKESTLIMEGKVNGKNEMERKAQLLALTVEERRAVNEAQDQLAMARLNYNKVVNEFKAARSMAQLFGQLTEEMSEQPAAAGEVQEQ